MSVFWIVTPWGLVSRYQRFGGTYCVHRHHSNPGDSGSILPQRRPSRLSVCSARYQSAFFRWSHAMRLESVPWLHSRVQHQYALCDPTFLQCCTTH
jgi:hypothetical protein